MNIPEGYRIVCAEPDTHLFQMNTNPWAVLRNAQRIAAKESREVVIQYATAGVVGEWEDDLIVAPDGSFRFPVEAAKEGRRNG